MSWVKTLEGWDHTDQRMKEIIFQVKAGRTHADIAAQFNISLPRISRIRRRLGLPDMRRGTRIKVIHSRQSLLG